MRYDPDVENKRGKEQYLILSKAWLGEEPIQAVKNEFEVSVACSYVDGAVGTAERRDSMLKVLAIVVRIGCPTT